MHLSTHFYIFLIIIIYFIICSIFILCIFRIIYYFLLIHSAPSFPSRPHTCLLDTSIKKQFADISKENIGIGSTIFAVKPGDGLSLIHIL